MTREPTRRDDESRADYSADWTAFRRTFLAAVGGTSTAALAGCASESGSGSEPSTDDGSTTVSVDGTEREAGGTVTTNGLDGIDVNRYLPSSATVAARATDDGRMVFDSPVVSVRVGGTVTWTIESGTHTVTAYHPEYDRPRRMPDEASPFDSGVLEAGETFEHAFDTEGVYDYYCGPHEGMGMVGTVVVGDPDPTDQAGLAEPEPSLPQGARDELATLGSRVRTDLEAPPVAMVAARSSGDGDVFSPSVVRVRPGGTVAWTVESGVHTVTAYHPDNDAPRRVPDEAAAFDSGTLETDATFEHAFDVEGVYDYFCVPHEGTGMVGTVVVGDPDPDGDEPGLAEPDGSRPDAAADAIRARTDEAVAVIEGRTPANGEDADDPATGEPASPDETGSNGTETDDAGERDPPAEHADAAATVSLRSDAFEPSLVRVEPGETVAWRVGTGMHTVTAYHPDNGKNRRTPDGADAFDSGFLAAGETFVSAFENEGVYDYFCRPHEGTGMVGTVVVGDPDPNPETEPGLTEPRSDVLAPTAVRDLTDAVTEALGGSSGGDPANETGTTDPTDGGGDASRGDADEPTDGGGEESDGGAGDASVAVTAADGAFSPSLVRIDPGETVAWTVDSSVHTVTAYHPDAEKTARVPAGVAGFDSGLLRAGETFTHTFDEAGVYDYFCVPHEGTGMVGSVVVGDPDPEGDEPGLSDPDDDVAAPTAVRELTRATLEALGGSVPEAGNGGGDETGNETGTGDSTRGDGGETDEPRDGSTDGAGSGDADAGATDAVDNYGFSPRVLRVEPGDSITWEIGEGVHSITAYHPDNDKSLRLPSSAAAFDSGLLQAGETFEHAFEVEGVYDYFCVPHEGMGMVGSVIVGDPDPDGDEPGLSDPADDVADPDAIRELNAAVIEALGGTPPAPTEGNDGTDGQAGEGGAGDAGGMGNESESDATSDEAPASSDGSEESSDLPETAEVTIPDRRFAPDLVRVAVGGTVRWRFDDDSHTVTAYEGRIPPSATVFDSGLRNAGDVFEHTFDVEGVYDYYCMPHVSHGMVGAVVVGDPDPEGDEPGLSDPTQGGDEGSALQSLTTRALELLRGEGADGGTAIDAATLDEADGGIDIQVRTDDGSVRPGGSHPIVARFEGKRLANAPVDVEGDFQGYTGEDGTFEVAVPRDLDSDDEFRIEIRVDGARGRVEVPVAD